MTKNRWLAALVGVVAALAIVGAYELGHVYAEGAPTTTPLYYSGFATESGTPIDGTRDVRIEVWRDATSTDTSMRACETIVNNAVFIDGHFRVALEPTCVTAMRAEPNLFVELLIEGTRIGDRAAIGAVPYALEADHAVSASTATGALDTRIDALEAPRSAFLARNTTAQSIPHATTLAVSFDSEEFDVTGDYDPATSTFTAPRAGIYDVGCNIFYARTGGAATFFMEAGVFVNDTRVDVDAGNGDGLGTMRRARSLVRLGAGDEVTCRTYQNSGGAISLAALSATEAESTFSAFFVSP
jgi:hypothetical protein